MPTPPFRTPRFRYKQQSFQQRAVRAVVDIFQGVDIGRFQRTPINPLARLQSANPDASPQSSAPTSFEFLLAHRRRLQDNLAAVQKRNRIRQRTLRFDNERLVLDTQMETGTGKTFTFINTIFELHREYGLTHFVIIVPSIAIKEGIKKSFETTGEYFRRIYRQRIKVLEIKPGKSANKRSNAPTEVMDFILDQAPTVLIMTNHAFNSYNKNLNRDLEGFYADQAETPMQAIASKHPVVIIDEPQRVEGKKTLERLSDFNATLMLRYSATFREGQIENLVYTLDSWDAFDQDLVKGISVADYRTDRTQSAFLGLKHLSKTTAVLDALDADGKPKTITIQRAEDENKPGKIYISTRNPQYRDLKVVEINSIENFIELSNGHRLHLGEYSGRIEANERLVDEIMLRDTIDRHLEKERRLFQREIKCLSLFFIDRVKDYRDECAAEGRGWLQESFERLYDERRKSHIEGLDLTDPWRIHLERWTAAEVHGGYFSQSKSSNSKLDHGKGDGQSEDDRKLQQEINELILRDKERVLNPNNKLRFIFAHSALREGWDNPNVFQICKLRTGYSQTSLVQEVGRGLRICVDANLERQDRDTIGSEFSSINRLHIFTLGNGDFIDRLQKEFGERRSSEKMIFEIRTEDLCAIYGIDRRQGRKVAEALYEAGCIDENDILISYQGMEGVLERFDLAIEKLILEKNLPKRLLESPRADDARKDDSKIRKYKASASHYEQFKELWRMLHRKVIYEIKYSDDFIEKARKSVDRIKDRIEPPSVRVKTESIRLGEGGIEKSEADEISAESKTPLVGSIGAKEFLNKLSEKTELPRNRIIEILEGIDPDCWQKIQSNPWLAIEEVKEAIVDVINTTIVDNIRYHSLDDLRDAWSQITLSDRRFDAKEYIDLTELEHRDNNLWEEIAPYDSIDPERKISTAALKNPDIIVFAKIPRTINIPAPLHPKGINPDFAFVVRGGEMQDSNFYFIAEAKPTVIEDDLVYPKEKYRIRFMERYFEGIHADRIRFKVVDGYRGLMRWFEESGVAR
ncbi:MAG: DEAD/DEAH box helicase family protein [Ectothiorhodospiraceae bacterium AqS1]|nr:DEAD/DEAH box helicase family protein [Ectothiorhodospiraceae bacterium AqS1]